MSWLNFRQTGVCRQVFLLFIYCPLLLRLSVCVLCCVLVICLLRPTLKIFLFPLTRPYFTGMGRLSEIILFYSPNSIPIINNQIGLVKVQKINWKFLFTTLSKANLKNIFVSPYPTLFYQYGSVVGKSFFLDFSYWIPIKLNCIQ